MDPMTIITGLAVAGSALSVSYHVGTLRAAHKRAAHKRDQTLLAAEKKEVLVIPRGQVVFLRVPKGGSVSYVSDEPINVGWAKDTLLDRIHSYQHGLNHTILNCAKWHRRVSLKGTDAYGDFVDPKDAYGKTRDVLALRLRHGDVPATVTVTGDFTDVLYGKQERTDSTVVFHDDGTTQTKYRVNISAEPFLD